MITSAPEDVDESPFGICAADLTRRDFLRIASLVFTGAFTLPGCGSGTSTSASSRYAATIVDARQRIQQSLSSTASISAALLDRDGIGWAEAFGVLDKESGSVPDTETLYGIGSCSKTIAAVAVMILVERDRIDLDTPFIRYVPTFRTASGDFAKITVRMLLAHSAGLPGTNYQGACLAVPRPNDYAEQVMRNLANLRLRYAPGTYGSYCNDGYTLIEILIQAVDGRSYADFVSQEIFSPLGMSHSQFPTDFFSSGSWAPGYKVQQKLPQKLPQQFISSYGAGATYASPSDLVKFGAMLMNGGVLNGVRILSRNSVNEMSRNQMTNDLIRPVQSENGFGLGWDDVLVEGPGSLGVRVWHKSGGTGIYLADLCVAPDEGISVAVAGNAPDIPTRDLAERILLNALVERGRLNSYPANLQANPKPSVPTSAEQLARVPGIYANRDHLYRVEPYGESALQSYGYWNGAWQPQSVARLRSDGMFSSDEYPNTSFKTVIDNGVTYLVKHSPNPLNYCFTEVAQYQRLPTKGSLSAAWQGRMKKRWLVVNEPVTTLAFDIYDPLLTISAIPDLSGYVLVTAKLLDNRQNQILDASISDDKAVMCLDIPWFTGMEMDDLIVEPRGAEEWMLLGGSRYRPESGIPNLGGGTQAIDFGSDGYGEWLKIGVNGLLTLTGTSAWKLFEADLSLHSSGNGATNTRQVSQGMFLLIYGPKNGYAQVVLSA